MLNRLKISARLWLLTSTLCFVAVVLTMAGLHSLGRMEASLRTVYVDRTVPAIDLGAITDEAHRSRFRMAIAAGSADLEKVAGYASQIAEIDRAIDRVWAKYRATYLTAEEVVLAAKIERDLADFREVREATMRFAAQGKRDQAMEISLGDGMLKFNRLRDSLKDLFDLQGRVAEEEYNQGQAGYAAAIRSAIAVTGAAIVIGVLLAYWIIRSISTPIASMNLALARLAKGDFSASADVTSVDELGEMAASFNAALAYVRASVVKVREAAARLARGDLSMRIGLDSNDELGLMAKDLDTAIEFMRTALTEVALAAEEVSEAAREMSAGSEELASGAQQQASSLEETSASLEQMTSSVKQTSDNAQEGAQASSKAREIATRGSQVASDAVRAMRDVNESSARIADIITTIDEIAFQTNLLALNAAVEAARAGEMGRGFAVVAAEVRSLAVRSATSAKEIKGLIQDSLRKVEAGSALVDLSGAALVEIVTSVKRVTDIAGEIASASREQAGGIDQVNRAMGQMDSVTQESASQTEQLAATAESMAAQGEELLELVGRFTLTAGEAGRGRATKRTPAAAKGFAHGGGGHGNPRALLAGVSHGKGRSPAKASASNGSHAVQNDVANDDEGGFELF